MSVSAILRFYWTTCSVFFFSCSERSGSMGRMHRVLIFSVIITFAGRTNYSFIKSNVLRTVYFSQVGSSTFIFEPREQFMRDF